MSHRAHRIDMQNIKPTALDVTSPLKCLLKYFESTEPTQLRQLVGGEIYLWKKFSELENKKNVTRDVIAKQG